MELLFEILLAYLLRYPGGLIRWLLFRKKPLKSYINDSISNNVYATSLFVGVIVAVVFIVKSSIN